MEVVKLNKIYIIGMKAIVSLGSNIILKLNKGFISRINEIKYKVSPQNIYGISFIEDIRNIKREAKFTYMIGVEVKKNFNIPPAMEFFEIKKSNYLKYKLKSKDLFKEYENIFFEICKNNLEIGITKIIEINGDQNIIYISIE